MENNQKPYLSDIIIYPIKSMRGIPLKKWKAQIKGLKYDRRWMLVNDNGEFLSQRKNPELARFNTALDDNGIIIEFNGDSIIIPFFTEKDGSMIAEIYDDRIEVPRATEKYHAWFSKHLEQRCYLVLMDQSVQREIDPRYMINRETVSFADGFPYLLISQGSLDILNSNLEAPLPMNRFRPNLVISGGEAFIEDSIDEFSIGNVRFKVVKPCARCVITTTDQSTGVRSKEPLRTLATFRKKNNKILFGQNVICLKEGIIHNGDEVVIHSRKPKDIE